MNWWHVYIAGGLVHFVVSLYGVVKAVTEGEMTMTGPTDEDTMRVVLGITLFVGAIGHACIWPLATVAQLATALIIKAGKGPPV